MKVTASALRYFQIKFIARNGGVPWDRSDIDDSEAIVFDSFANSLVLVVIPQCG